MKVYVQFYFSFDLEFKNISYTDLDIFVLFEFWQTETFSIMEVGGKMFMAQLHRFSVIGGLKGTSFKHFCNQYFHVKNGLISHFFKF